MPSFQFRARDIECCCVIITSAKLFFCEEKWLRFFISMKNTVTVFLIRRPQKIHGILPAKKKIMAFCQILGICWLGASLLLFRLKNSFEEVRTGQGCTRDSTNHFLAIINSFISRRHAVTISWPQMGPDQHHVMFYLTYCKSISKERWGNY